MWFTIMSGGSSLSHRYSILEPEQNEIFESPANESNIKLSIEIARVQIWLIKTEPQANGQSKAVNATFQTKCNLIFVLSIDEEQWMRYKKLSLWIYFFIFMILLDVWYLHIGFDAQVYYTRAENSLSVKPNAIWIWAAAACLNYLRSREFLGLCVWVSVEWADVNSR